jgi:hypothetical protein
VQLVRVRGGELGDHAVLDRGLLALELGLRDAISRHRSRSASAAAEASTVALRLICFSAWLRNARESSISGCVSSRRAARTRRAARRRRLELGVAPHRDARVLLAADQDREVDARQVVTAISTTPWMR